MQHDAHWQAALAALEWQIELGATEAICDTPQDRYAATAQGAAAAVTPMQDNARGPDRRSSPDTGDPIAEARTLAAGAQDLAQLRAALAGYRHCALQASARNLVFSDGQPGARVMIIGEAPGRDEDLQGRPFVGRAGQLLDRMFDAIGMGRAHPDRQRSLYITNILPWRPPQNRDPSPAEIAMMMPFVERHVALADPALVVLMGNIACQAVLGQKGITRLRGQWQQAFGRPALPMLHPAYLLRQPQAKRHAWADLLSLQSRMKGDHVPD